MSSNDAQVIAMDNREDTSPSHMQLLAAPFAVTPGQQDIVPPSSRSSFTRVDLDDEQRLHRSASHDPITPSMTLPTLLHTANIVAVDQTLISTLSQEQQQLKIQTETPTPAEPAMEGTVPQMPQIYLNFLLISGKRRTMSFEPDTTVGRVKELVWNSWPADWQDDRPPAPSYLRVLYLGRMLQDDETLNHLKLPTHTPHQLTPSSSSSTGPTTTVMHLSIRPYALPGEGDAIKKKKKRVPEDAAASNEPNEQIDEAGCCRCIIC